MENNRPDAASAPGTEVLIDTESRTATGKIKIFSDMQGVGENLCDAGGDRTDGRKTGWAVITGYVNPMRPETMALLDRMGSFPFSQIPYKI